jgi:hypothetical protein
MGLKASKRMRDIYLLDARDSGQCRFGWEAIDLDNPFGSAKGMLGGCPYVGFFKA